MDAPSDPELLSALRSESRAVRAAAFTALFERHSSRAHDLAFRVLGDAGSAADVTQDVFLALYRDGARFDARARFTSWLHRVVLNRAIDVRRRELRRPGGSRILKSRPSATASGAMEAADPLTAAASPEPGPAADVLNSERVRRVRAAIDGLSEKLAEVVVLRYLQGLTYEEIGDILTLPPGTVKSRLNRAHDALREVLGDMIDEV